MNFDDFIRVVTTERAAGRERLLVPITRRLSADLLTPVSAFLSLREGARYGFLLESVEGGEKLARYSFLGRNPYRIVRSSASVVTVEEGGLTVSVDGTIFDVLNRYLANYSEVRLPGMPRFTAGAVGYMGYDVVRTLEHLPAPPVDGLDHPDAVWCFYDTVVAFDHVRHQLILMAAAFVTPDDELESAYEKAIERLNEIERTLSSPRYDHPAPIRLSSEPRSNCSRESFELAVDRARHYIYEGDIFQVVLSQRFETGYEGDRFNLYRALRQVNPSPYLFYLMLDEIALIGSSPEVLVRVDDGRAELLPIAGTRPRGGSDEQDGVLQAELLDDPKERAEHLMLVDLGRNDLGRVCTYGSVNVDAYAYVERYSHVMHIVSSVSGNVARGRSATDVLAATFPAGTVSGAPKVRAMEVIDELETDRRGVYAGAVGYLDFSGNLDTCIAIRTMVVTNDRVYIQAGAGVVADSDPTREYDETVNKARALHSALLIAAEGLL